MRIVPAQGQTKKIGIAEDINLVWENFRSFMLNWDVKMNQCYPKCVLGILRGVLYLHGILTDRHAARSERMRKKHLGMIHGAGRRRWKECQGVKNTGRKRRKGEGGREE